MDNDDVSSAMAGILACTNCDKKPSQVRNVPFLYEENATQMAANRNFDDKNMGKWIMFFDRHNGELDTKWAEAKLLYNEAKLEGIICMKVSTEYEDPSATDTNKGVIIFYCGPWMDEAKMMDIGRKLRDQIPYRHAQMHYKSDLQTMLLEGPDHLYTIEPST